MSADDRMDEDLGCSDFDGITAGRQELIQILAHGDEAKVEFGRSFLQTDLQPNHIVDARLQGSQ